MQTKDYLETLENQISETENLSSLFGSISIVNSKLISQLVKELKAAREVVDIADRLAKYIEDEDDYRELRQAIKAHEVVGEG